MPALARRSLTELIGTALIVFFGCAAPIMDNYSRYNLLGMALLVSVAYIAVLAVTLSVSQGYVNPAVTLGLMVARRLDPREGVTLFLSQVVGSVAGGVLAKLLLPGNVGRVIAYGTPTVNNTLSFRGAVSLEAFLVFFVMSVILMVAVPGKRPGLAPVAVGLAVFPSMMVAGPLTGGVLNPARAFGPAVVTGTFTAQAVWWVGPIIGAVIAAGVWSVIGREARSEMR